MSVSYSQDFTFI